MKGEERRKYIRVYMPNGEMRILSGPVNALVGKIVDISIGGIRFVTDSEYKHGESLDLDLKLPNGFRLGCVAEIVAVSCIEGRTVYMAKFTKINDFDRDQLGDIIVKLKIEQDAIVWKKMTN
jgi:hypothetical protein